MTFHFFYIPFTNDVAKWAKNNLDTALSLSSTKPTNVNITLFKNLFEVEFPAQVVEI